MIKKVIIIILTVLLLIVIAGAIYLCTSPMPGVFLLRHAFGGDAQAKNVDDYEERRARVDIRRDLEYPSQDGRNKYDLYLPENAKEPLPVIVWVHGGAFVAGDKSGVENWAVMLADQGYAVAAVDYQWAPEIAYPGQVRQVEECMAQLQKMAAQGEPLDMSRVVIAGDSAGAHIGAQAGLLATNPDYEKQLGVKSVLAKEDLKGLLLYCGPYNVEKILNVEDKLMRFFASRIGWAMFGDKHWQDGNMIQTTTIKDYVTQDFPPSLIADGNTGSFEMEGRELAQTLEEKGIQVCPVFFEKDQGEIGHEYQFDLSKDVSLYTWEQTLDFLNQVIWNK